MAEWIEPEFAAPIRIEKHRSDNKPLITKSLPADGAIKRVRNWRTTEEKAAQLSVPA